MRRIQAAAVFSLLLIGAACGDSQFSSDQADDADGSASDAGSDATLDASADGSATDATGDEIDNVPGNVLMDPSFESHPSSGCGIFWTTGGTTSALAISTVAHSGLQSCLVCGFTNTAGDLVNNTNTETLAGLDAGIYELAAWVMPVDVDAGPASASSLVEIFQQFEDAGATETFGGGTAITVGKWQKVYYDTPLGSDEMVEFHILGYPNGNLDAGVGCMLVDDISLVLQ